VSARARARCRALALLAALVAPLGCERPEPFDPEASARTILRECGNDPSCVRERWHRDPRGWSLGLRAEVAGRDPQAPLVVETTRDIVSRELGRGACATSAGGDGIDYRTRVTPKGSDQFATVLFRWESYEAALIGHRQVVATVARARGDEEALWKSLQGQAALERACLRFRGKQDRCDGGE
jgi:hypothetical protein